MHLLKIILRNYTAGSFLQRGQRTGSASHGDGRRVPIARTAKKTYGNNHTAHILNVPDSKTKVTGRTPDLIRWQRLWMQLG